MLYLQTFCNQLIFRRITGSMLVLGNRLFIAYPHSLCHIVIIHMTHMIRLIRNGIIRNPLLVNVPCACARPAKKIQKWEVIIMKKITYRLVLKHIILITTCLKLVEQIVSLLNVAFNYLSIIKQCFLIPRNGYLNLNLKMGSGYLFRHSIQLQLDKKSRS